MKFITYYELNNDIINNLHKIPRDIDLIVGIPRSGLLVANMIALYLNKPITDIDSYLDGKIFGVGSTKNTSQLITCVEDAKKVLIIDDSVATGKSMSEAKQRLEKLNECRQQIFLAAYVKKAVKKEVDIYFKVIDEDRMFEWNYMHHVLLERACIDIDGVLCVDPTAEQNDDGVNYINFLKMATPKLLPSRKVGYLVTSRLEKYRKETEEWLHQNGVEYKKLFMMNVATAEERRQLGNHGAFKAGIYKRLKDANLFIESEETQAKEISDLSGKMVFCIENQICYSENSYHRLKVQFDQNVLRKIKMQVKKVVPESVIDLYHKMKRKS